MAYITIQTPAPEHDISSKGVVFVMQREGDKHKAYLDTAGIPTICVGAIRDLDGKPVHMGQVYSEADCLRLLDRDIKSSENTVKAYVVVPLYQEQFDSLTSFTFNIGNYGFKKSSLLRNHLNKGDYTGAAEDFMSWDKITYKGQKVVDKGLHNRRLHEKNLFETGDYQ